MGFGEPGRPFAMTPGSRCRWPHQGYSPPPTGIADITYTSRDFKSTSESDAVLPWNKQVTVTGFVKSVSVLATLDARGGTIQCRILRDGKVIAQDSKTGTYAVVSCAAGQLRSMRTNGRPRGPGGASGAPMDQRYVCVAGQWN
jgi:hypothetical protein